ncbi:MAG: transposase [Cyanothece sp. SIO1E1]|nr:transposase [Cyanothece sp. SIO1E1]
MKRDFTKIAERPGISQAIGEALLKQEEMLFKLWYRVRDGTLTRSGFIEAVKPIRADVNSLLTKAASYQIGGKDKTPLAKTVRTCRRWLKMEPALWLFVTTEGGEPTNNDSEQALRPAVIWRRISFGSQTEAGGTFVARMLTVVTLRSQERNVLEYMTEACRAAREGKPAPPLLPQQHPLEQAQDSPAA